MSILQAHQPLVGYDAQPTPRRRGPQQENPFVPARVVLAAQALGSPTTLIGRARLLPSGWVEVVTDTLRHAAREEHSKACRKLAAEQERADAYPGSESALLDLADAARFVQRALTALTQAEETATYCYPPHEIRRIHWLAESDDSRNYSDTFDCYDEPFSDEEAPQ